MSITRKARILFFGLSLFAGASTLFCFEAVSKEREWCVTSSEWLTTYHVQLTKSENLRVDLHDASISNVLTIDKLNLWAIGRMQVNGIEIGLVIQSTDAGKTWNERLSSPELRFYDIPICGYCRPGDTRKTRSYTQSTARKPGQRLECLHWGNRGLHTFYGSWILRMVGCCITTVTS